MLRVKEILKEKNITAKYLAEKIGMSEVGLSKAISENGNPPLKRLNEIAGALGVPISDLFKVPKFQTYLTCPNCGSGLEIGITNVEWAQRD